MTDIKVKVFISYSHKDEILRDELAEHLKPLERQSRIETWHDRKVEPGTNWRQELDAQLNSADIVLLLVSSSFINSDFCYCTELEQARKRHDAGEARIIPIFLREIDLEALEGTPLQTLQGLPEPTKHVTSTKWGDRDEAYAHVARGIRAVVDNVQQQKKEVQQAAQALENRPSLMRSRVPDENYIERDQAKRLLERFAAALKQPHEKPLLFNIYGTGGVGKTTLLVRLQEVHEGKVDFLKVCFAKTVDIETPLKLMRKLHQQAMKLLGAETGADSFTKWERHFEATLYQLSHQSVDGGAASSEDSRKITSWFERFIWLGSTSLTSTPNKQKSFETSRSEFSALAAMSDDIEGLQEWIQQRVRNHPATKDKLELQALMLEPVPKLTQAFAESLIQIAQSRERPLVLVLDTYEKAQAYLNQWLWQYLVEDTPLSSAPVRLVVVGRRSLQTDEGWRKLNQDRKLLYEVQLQKFERKDTEEYLQKIGILNGGNRAKIYRATQGLPYYLDWVRWQREQGNEPDFSKGNQAIAELLLQGIDFRRQRLLQVVACCRWFDLAIIRYLIGSDSSGLQQDDDAESCFEWLKRSDFIECTKGRYRLDDVARDVFRQSFFQDDQTQFRKINALLADYFKQRTDRTVNPQSLLPDPYEDEDWREMIAEFLYYSLFGKGKEGLWQYIEQVFAAVYLREPDVFVAPFAFIAAEISEENQNLLPQATNKFFKASAIALRGSWFFLDKLPETEGLQFEDEDNLSKEMIEARSKKLEDSLQALLEYAENLQDGFGKCVGLMYKSLRCSRSREKIDLLLQAKIQTKQLSTYCRPKLMHVLFENLARLLVSAGHFQDSLDCYEKALELKQGSEFTFLGCGVALANLKRHEEALENCQKAIDLNPKFVEAWALRGRALCELELHEEALESFQEAIDLDPDCTIAWRGRGNVLCDLRRYQEAIVACARAFEIDAKELNTLNVQALVLSFLKDFEQAISFINRAISLYPQEVLLKANRGIILARASRYTEALADCEQAIKQDPKHESGYYGKACCCALQGENEQTIHNLQKAINIAPHHSRSEAKYNPDFDSIRNNEKFRTLVYLEPQC